MNQNKIVLCMKWGTLFPSEYVNVLYHACVHFITGEFRFVCLTNEPEGIDPNVEVFPIPEIGLDNWHYYNGAWPKLGVFIHDLYGLKGRCLFIDLDTVLLENIDSFFELTDPFIAIDSRPWRYKSGLPRTGTGIFAFEIGSLDFVLEGIKNDRDNMVETYKIEQDYLHGILPMINYWPQEWVISFKYHVRRPILLDRFFQPQKPANSAKVLAFHGKPRPIDLIRPPKGNWDKFPHYGSGPVDWMQTYWKDHGGQL
jgi:hypothetical protein